MHRIGHDGCGVAQGLRDNTHQRRKGGEVKEKDAFIHRIKRADVRQTDWHCEIIDSINDMFARGYITARVEGMDDAGISFNSEAFRRALLTIAEYSIWNKPPNERKNEVR
jgi:hypothetical protein